MQPTIADWDQTPMVTDAPDFKNLLAVLSRSVPDRPTLFEFFLNEPLYRRLARSEQTSPDPDTSNLPRRLAEISAFRNAGYDYATLLVPGFDFPTGHVRTESTRSLNDGAVISDRRTFEEYEWPDPDRADYGIIDEVGVNLPDGMSLIVWGPCGVLENVTALVGYENLCYMLVDDITLVRDLCDAVGSRLLRYYERCLDHRAVGAIIGNDDWGYKSQTMLAPRHMRELIFPWHTRIVEAAHSSGRPAILHSCGRLEEIMDDVIEVMKYDGKHSFEDSIEPVEFAYERYHDRIAILGGIDMDFVCRSSPEAINERARQMLARTRETGGYALGTGNSVPEYVPDRNYFAMIRAALDR